MSCVLKVKRIGENAWELLEDFTLATDKYKVTVKKDLTLMVLVFQRYCGVLLEVLWKVSTYQEL